MTFVFIILKSKVKKSKHQCGKIVVIKSRKLTDISQKSKVASIQLNVKSHKPKVESKKFKFKRKNSRKKNVKNLKVNRENREITKVQNQNTKDKMLQKNKTKRKPKVWRKQSLVLSTLYFTRRFNFLLSKIKNFISESKIDTSQMTMTGLQR